MKTKPYDEWQDVQKELFTEQEIEEAKIEAEILEVFIQARKKKLITQKQLEELCGIKQPMIARIENGETTPRVDTLIKLLLPLGYTLKVVPRKDNER